jgi:hypothetical protein
MVERYGPNSSIKTPLCRISNSICSAFIRYYVFTVLSFSKASANFSVGRIEMAVTAPSLTLSVFSQLHVLEFHIQTFLHHNICSFSLYQDEHSICMAILEMSRAMDNCVE